MERRNVLDHGYVELIEHWGSDERIIEAARMSTGKGFKGWGPQVCKDCGGTGFTVPKVVPTDPAVDCPVCKGEGAIYGDEKLLRYLWTHKHTTPFEMAGFVIEVQAPIFVFREWHRHRTQSFNEMSARYVPLPDVNYVPSVERIMMLGGTNKQSQSTGAVCSAETALDFRVTLFAQYASAETLYVTSLGAGIPKELARLCLPVGRYSRMRASANLLNWLRFLTLRADEHAQWEIQQYANVVLEIVRELFPRTATLFDEKRL